METYQYAEGIFITLKKEPIEIKKNKDFEEQIESEQNLFILADIFNDLEQRSLKLIDSNIYFKENKDEEEEFDEYIKENQTLIQKNIYKLGIILKNFQYKIPYSELLEYKKKYDNLVQKI